ncbi:MAG: DoxX family membrane protein [Bacteroidetes bacterium]|nr:MAG: DoxX family membrane protein [Bacteroidota bacterium]
MRTNNPTYSTGQLSALVILRMLIGWHLLYEGVAKLWSSGWSAAGYLNDSAGLFAGMFKAMAGSEGLMTVVNFLNVWGLILIGLGLILGLASRWAALGGVVLLVLYYLSHPPLIGVQYALPSEGNYLWVNKNLIEAAALLVVMLFPTEHIVGLARFFGRKSAQPVVTASGSTQPVSQEKAHA